MKRFALIVFTFLPAFSVLSFAQNITGIWRGYFIADNGGQYRFEVQIEQTPNNTLSGVTYSYQDTRFYGKSAMTGNFSKASGSALIQEIKTIEIKIESGFVPCIQKFNLLMQNPVKKIWKDYLAALLKRQIRCTTTFEAMIVVAVQCF
jgi:hypothetical protein